MGILDPVGDALGLDASQSGGANYGNDPDYQAKKQAYYDQQTAAAQARQAPTLDWSQANQAAGLQNSAAQSYQGVLNGTQPSLAQQQMQAGLQQANADASSQAASIRGGGSNAVLAAQGAAQQDFQRQMATNAQAGMLRAQELDQARGGLGGLASNMRGQAQQQTEYGGTLQQNQMQINDAAANNWQKLNQGMNDTQYNGANKTASDNAQLSSQNKGQNKTMIGGMLNSGGAIATLMSDVAVKEDIRPIADGKGLAAIMAMPVSSWRYKPGDAPSGDTGGEHVGTMAQAFAKAAGKAGAPQKSDKTIDVVTSLGLLTAAVQDLNKKTDQIGKAAR